MEPVVWAYIVIIFLSVATVFAFVHSHAKRIAREDMLASNARVLREFKRIAIYQPEKIVDNTLR